MSGKVRTLRGSLRLLRVRRAHLGRAFIQSLQEDIKNCSEERAQGVVIGIALALVTVLVFAAL